MVCIKLCKVFSRMQEVANYESFSRIFSQRWKFVRKKVTVPSFRWSAKVPLIHGPPPYCHQNLCDCPFLAPPFLDTVAAFPVGYCDPPTSKALFNCPWAVVGARHFYYLDGVFCFIYSFLLIKEKKKQRMLPWASGLELVSLCRERFGDNDRFVPFFKPLYFDIFPIFVFWPSFAFLYSIWRNFTIGDSKTMQLPIRSTSFYTELT
jgi:hypothetical protein